MIYRNIYQKAGKRILLREEGPGYCPRKAEKQAEKAAEAVLSKEKGAGRCQSSPVRRHCKKLQLYL